MVYSSQIASLNEETIMYLEEAFITLFFIISIVVAVFVWWVFKAMRNMVHENSETPERDRVGGIFVMLFVSEWRAFCHIFRPVSYYNNTDAGPL